METQQEEQGRQSASELERYRTFSYEVATAIAPTWEARRAEIEDLATPARDWMVRELDAKPGDTILELAAGVGDTGFEVAAIVGEEGRVISSDFSPPMIDAARRRGTELGLSNVDYRVIDAEQIELEADSVDGVLCRCGYMLMPDAAKALSETRRVLRPGGRLTLAVWGSPERNPFFTLVAVNLVQRGHIPPPDPEGPGIFSMGSEERTVALLEEAGFEQRLTEEIPVRFAFRDVDEYLAFVGDTAGPVAFALRGLAAEEREAIKAAIEEALPHFAKNGGYELPGVMIVAVAS